jgi:HSP20 family protein
MMMDKEVLTMSKNKHKGIATASHTAWPPFGSAELWPLLTGPELRVEEFRDGDEAVVRVEVPGVDPEKDIQVTVREGDLYIHAQRALHDSRAEDGSYRSEFRYGSFDRTLRLPPGVSSGAVSATYHDGILEVRAPSPGPAATDGECVSITRT